MLDIKNWDKIYIAVETVDFRKQISAMAEYIQNELRKSPQAKTYFILMSKNRKQIRILTHDGTGLCMFTKKIDSGNFGTIAAAKEDIRKKVIKFTKKETVHLIEYGG